MASFGKQSPWAPRRGQPGQNSMYSNYSSNAPVTYPIGYIQEHHGSGSSGGAKTRSFTGVVTKMSDNHGFIDKDVYFHVSACENTFPAIGDRVMVEAIYNPNNPYKWTSTRVKVIEDRTLLHKRERSPIRGRDHFDRRNEEIDRKRRKIDDRSRDRHDKDKIHRERERERERLREKDKLKEKEHERQQVSPRRRSRSPLRARRPLRYIVKVPNDLLTLSEYDVTLLKKRFRFYIPSDFFNASVLWTELFPPDRPYSLEKPCAFHVMHKDCEPVIENNAIYEPADADYVYSTQVMLVSFPTMEEIYQKCITLTEDEEKANDKLVHISKLIQFLVRSRKNEPASIGGPWSPSLDGPNPDKDPSVLIKTAIRTCKALTGIDLSNCTQWYRVLEVNYHRSESVYKGKAIPARIETVIYFLPEVWTCAPTQLEWENLVSNYGKLLEVKLNPIHEVKETSSEEAKPNSNPVLQSQNQTAQKDEVETDDKDEELIVIDKCEPTHYSKLDPKNMKVSELRQELEARNLSPKGLKPQLMARLQKALKSEEEKKQEEQQEERKPETESTEKTDESTTEDSSTKEVIEEEKPVKEETVQAMSESERANWTKRYTLPNTPHIIVHPSKTAKSGKFECMVVSLSSLLDYHSDFMREDIFEVRLFAELFNDMLTRDFGYEIFKALYQAPEKPKEEKEEKDKKENEEKKEKVIEKKEEQKDETDNKVKENDSTELMETEVKEDTYITVDEDKTGESKLEAEDGELTKEEEKTEEENKEQPNGTGKEDAVVEKPNKEEVKKKKPIKYYTKDKFLLLSFAFFDHSNCGYIFEKDLETLFQCIGLFFSRSQIKKIINKVSIRDTVHYRKLTDKPKEDDEDQEEEIVIKLEDDEIPVQITLNKKLLQSMVDGESGDSPKRSTRKSKSSDAQTKTISGGLVQYNGALVDVEKLLSSIKRSESARLEMENVIQSLKQENETLKENAKRSSEKAKNTSADLNTCREKLMSSNKEVITLKGKLRSHLKVFQTIKENVDPIIESNEKSTTDKAKEKPAETDAANSDDKDKLPNSNDAGEPTAEKEVSEAASDQNTDNQTTN